ncbi:DMT family transporter [Acinetobacter sp. HY1485]|uniref:DMT family transporter n=1 Tax=Acinetobacter sp. HY1485 TaxID=2970918 RepID=UPI0022B94AC6|nr:DMT family transporter [Acinetobacter sp. HY1485]
MKNLGPILIIMGAVSYAAVGIVLALAKQNGFSIEEIIVPMYSFALFILFILFIFSKKDNLLSRRESILFLLAGLLTVSITYCFYQSLNYIGVPLATLFLMQSSWITPLLSCALRKNLPKRADLIMMLIVMFGVTISCYTANFNFSFYGIIWGLGAAISYSIMLVFSERFGKNKNVFEKSAIMSLGALVVSIILFSSHATINIISSSSAWALIYACFATVLPLTLLTLGMQKVSSELAGLLITLEIPAAYILSYIFLSENININQILGCVIITFTIMYPKINQLFKKKYQ